MRNAKLVVFALVLALGISATCLISSLVAEQTRWEAPGLNMSYVQAPQPDMPVEKLGDNLWSVGGLKVVVASGSPREMGRQYGRAVADDIKRGRDSYLYKRVRDDQGYSMDYLLKCSEAMLKHISPEYIEEMKGVAEGAGIPYEEVLAMHTHADIVHYGHDWGKENKDDGDAAGCSNFVAWGPATVGGAVYHGRNLDWTTQTEIQDIAVVYIGIPEKGHPFALVTYAGMTGAVTGMNARGITFGEMTSTTGDQTLDGEPLFFTCRRILQYCGNIAEAEQMVQTHAGTTGWNFMIASGNESTARAFEVDASEVATFAPNDPQENHPPVSEGFEYALYRTNHPVSPMMQEKAAKNYGIKSLALAKIAIRGMDTWQRYESMRQWITGEYYGKIDENIARAILQSKPLDAGNNLHSVVFAPGELKMWVANAKAPPDPKPAFMQPYHLIDLAQFIAGRE